MGRFKIWSGNLGVFAADTASADFRLKDDQDVKDVLIDMISCLREQVEQLTRPSLLPTLLEEQIEDKSETESLRSPASSTASSSSWKLSSDSDSATRSESIPLDTQRQHNSLAQITDIVNRLYRFSTVIRKPVSLGENARIAHYIEKTKDSLELDDFESYIKWQIRQWCPSTTDKLIDRLSNAAMLRRKKLLYRQRHQQKLNQGTDDWFITRNPASVYLESGNSFKAGGPQVQGVGLMHKPPTKMRKSVAFSTTKASSIDKLAVPAYTRSVAPSGITKTGIAGRELLDIPLAPKPRGEHEAKCPYCSKFLTKEQLTKAQWTSVLLPISEKYLVVRC